MGILTCKQDTATGLFHNLIANMIPNQSTETNTEKIIIFWNNSQHG